MLLTERSVELLLVGKLKGVPSGSSVLLSFNVDHHGGKQAAMVEAACRYVFTSKLAASNPRCF